MATTLQVSGQSLTGLLAVLKPGELRGTEADWLGREPELVAGVGWHTTSLAGRRLQPALALRALVILPGPPRSLIPLVLEASLLQYGHLSEQSRPPCFFFCETQSLANTLWVSSVTDSKHLGEQLLGPTACRWQGVHICEVLRRKEYPWAGGYSGPRERAWGGGRQNLIDSGQ